MAPEDPTRTQDRKERAAILGKSVSDTVEFINRYSPQSVSSYPAAGILLANSYFLVSDAYKRCRGMQASRTHPDKVAAFTAATIMAVRPIRVIDTARVVSTKVAFANQQCAMRAVQALLGLDPETLEEDFSRRLYASVLGPIEMPCLTAYLTEFESKFPMLRLDTFEALEEVIDFNRYNVLEFSTEELQMLEALINQFTTLERSAGNPFVRIFSRLGRWWAD